MVSHNEAGFTLIEALVAMVVLALGAMSLLSAIEGHTARIHDVSARQAARWAAQYAFTAAELGLDIPSPTIYGYDFTIDTQTQPTQDEDLIKLSLFLKERHSGRNLFVLDGYIQSQRGR